MADIKSLSETDKEVLSEVKYRTGIFFEDEQVDKSTQGMIESCKQHLIIAGVDETVLVSPLAVDLFVMWVEAKRDGSFSTLTTSPAFIGLTVQLKSQGVILK